MRLAQDAERFASPPKDVVDLADRALPHHVEWSAALAAYALDREIHLVVEQQPAPRACRPSFPRAATHGAVFLGHDLLLFTPRSCPTTSARVRVYLFVEELLGRIHAMDYPQLLLAMRSSGRLQYQVAHAAGIREGRLSEIVRRGACISDDSLKR
jgi:hypothetical protein